MKEIKAPKLVAANEENMSIPTELFEKTKKRIDEIYKCTEDWERSRFVLKIVELENLADHYKEVIDKAIEYIQNNILGIDIETNNIMINREKILDILKESD